MKHSILRKLMLIAVLLTSSNAFAHDFEVGGIYYNITSSSDKTCEATYQGTSYSEYSNEYTGEIVIPESVTSGGATYSVTSIGEWAFRYCTGLTSVTIPNSVTRIGNYAFSHCSSLTSATIPNSVTSIGYEAFRGCSGLTSITIPNSVTSIGSGAFYDCTGLTSVTIPNSVTSIDRSAFRYCSGLTSVTIPNSVTSIGEWAFSYCTSLTSVIIPYSVTSIGNYAFTGCNGLTNITIPYSVTSIGNNAFSHCSGLTSIIVESGNTVYDSRDNCNAIIETSTNTLITGCKNTVIPNSVTSIGNSAFNGCAGLTSVAIPNSVTSIGDYAFYYCSGLTNVIIPNSVTSISSLAFSGCSGLTSIVIESGNTQYDSRNNCNAIIETSTNTLITGCKNTVIPNSVISIRDYAFTGCSGLTNITIPNSVTSIGNYAFSGCSGLTNVTCESKTPPTATSTTFRSVPTTATLYVPVGSKDAYASADGWSYFSNIVEYDTITRVESTLSNHVTVSVENGNIVINGVINNENVGVFNVNGQCVYSGTATTIPVNTKGLYIVKVNGKSFKVML